jgi:cytochrome P450
VTATAGPQAPPAQDLETSYDHVAVSAMAAPFDLIAQTRSACPVAHTSSHGGYWVLQRHEDVVAAAKDPQRFCSGQGVTIPHHSFPIELPPLECDAPRHMQFRTPFTAYFSPNAIRAMEPSIREAVRGLIAGFIERGSADLAQELTMRLPALAITQLLNIPAADRESFLEWTVRLIRNPEDFEAAGAALMYFAQVRADRIAHPQADIPTMMLGIEVEGQVISEQDYLCLINVLVMAGLDTTANAAANMLEVLATDTAVRQQLADDPELIRSAIEELLRFVTPLPALARTATDDVVIGDAHIAAGERVLLSWIAANHDPETFPDPDALDLTRRNIAHVAFGSGPHRCLGAHLARLELVVLLEELLRVMPDYTIDSAGVERFGGITRGIAALPATFTPRPRADLWVEAGFS